MNMRKQVTAGTAAAAVAGLATGGYTSSGDSDRSALDAARAGRHPQRLRHRPAVAAQWRRARLWPGVFVKVLGRNPPA